MNIVEDLSDVPFILFGDVNTWTGKETPESDELTEFPFNIFEDGHDVSERISMRELDSKIKYLYQKIKKRVTLVGTC